MNRPLQVILLVGVDVDRSIEGLKPRCVKVDTVGGLPVTTCSGGWNVIQNDNLPKFGCTCIFP